MIYLLGVDHNSQHDGLGSDLAASNKLRKSLSMFAVESEIQMIAEEFSEEALYSVSNGTCSTCRLVAEELGIEHLYCDPNTEQRAKYGIPTQSELVEEVKNELGVKILFGESLQRYDEKHKKTFAKRESFWLNALKLHISKKIIFVCGINHIKSFSSLLGKSKIKYQKVNV
jgi:hypothetical protein